MITGKILKKLFVTLLAGTALISGCTEKNKPTENKTVMSNIEGSSLVYQLPSPRIKGEISLEETFSKRRSHRSYTNQVISAEDLSQILWAAYGITKPLDHPRAMGGLRTAPSAGSTYPLNIYVLVGNVRDIEPGVYKYVSDGHKIIRVNEKDVRADLCAAALNQEMIKDAPVCMFYSATYERTTKIYGTRGSERYVCIDLGHSAENVYLQAEALHLGTCAIGAFTDDAVKKVMQLPEEETPLYIMPIGRYKNE